MTCAKPALFASAACGVFLAHPFAAHAQAASDPAVVVTATRTPKPKLAVASSITLITADEIAAKEERTLPDVLKDAPGLNVVQTGGPGGQTSVFMRGTNSNHVKVLVDGIDVGDPSNPNGSFDFGQFPVSDVERVEILRGPQSGLYGSDAIGGVINIITKSGEGPPQLTAGMEGGSFATFNQNAELSGSTGPFHYVATVQHLRSAATPVTPLDLLLPGERRIDDSYDNVTASTRLGYDVTDNFDLGLVARYTDTRELFTGDNFTMFPSAPDPTHSSTDTLQYYTRGTGHLILFGGRFDQTVGAAFSSINTTETSPDAATSYFSGRRVKLDWQGDIKVVKDETLVLGAEYQHDSTSMPVSASTSTASGYAELDSSPFTNFNNSVSVRYDANDRFGGQATWRIAPTYFIAATGSKIEASVGTGFKAPTLSQLFQNFPSFDFFGNPNLRPETSIGYDVGFEQFLFNNRLQFGVTYYYNSIRNLISDNASFTTLINVGRAHTDGVESFISIRPLKTLSLRVDYTYTEAQDDVLHQWLVRRPRNKWNVDARWQATDKLSFDADLLSVSSFADFTRDVVTSMLIAPGYTTVDIAASYDLTNKVTIYGRLANLFDERYQDPTGFLHPSRGVFFGIKAKL